MCLWYNSRAPRWARFGSPLWCLGHWFPLTQQHSNLWQASLDQLLSVTCNQSYQFGLPNSGYWLPLGRHFHLFSSIISGSGIVGAAHIPGNHKEFPYNMNRHHQGLRSVDNRRRNLTPESKSVIFQTINHWDLMDFSSSNDLLEGEIVLTAIDCCGKQ